MNISIGWLFREELTLYMHIGDKSVNQVTANHMISLTARGHAQAADCGKTLNSMLHEDDNVLFYTSPYKRARQTTEGIVSGIDEKFSYKINEDARLREQDFGNFQGCASEMNRIWTDRAHYGHFFYRIPNGESAADVYDRCSGFNETLFRQFSSDKFPSVLVLVAHGIWIRVFLMKWYRWTYEEFESLKNIPHCQFIIMTRNEENHKFTLKTRLRKWEDPEEEVLTEDDDLSDAVGSGSPLTTREFERMKQKERQIRTTFARANSVKQQESRDGKTTNSPPDTTA